MASGFVMNAMTSRLPPQGHARRSRWNDELECRQGRSETGVAAHADNMGDMLRDTARLFARPSMTRGMGMVLDVGGQAIVYNRNLASEEADFCAKRSK